MVLHYLPGCDVFKNHPIASQKIQQYMRQKEAMIDHCCRVKEQFLTDEDEIVINCTLCDLILKETHPHTKRISLYEYVLKDADFPWINHDGETIIIQDCWRTRDDFHLQKAVRECLEKMHFHVIEMDENYEKTKYCGVWLYNYPAKECIDVAPQTFHQIIANDMCLLSNEEQIAQMKEWCKRYTTDHIAVYCNGCERGIKLGGKTPIHMIELLAQGLL